MDWLQAVSSWVGSLAWPAAVIVLIVMLKTPLSGALSTLRHIEAPGGLKADFGAVIKDAEDRSEDLKDDIPSGAPKPTPVEPEPDADEAVTHDPSGVIIRAYQQLNDEVVGFAKETGVLREGHSRGLRFLVHGFQIDGSLERDALFTLLELSELRDRVAHGAHTPTPGEAITYRTTAENVRAYVQFKREHERAHGKGDELTPPTDDRSRG